ncbi:MAG: YgaP-like transmembrane domain [Actinomycetota bacterium]
MQSAIESAATARRATAVVLELALAAAGLDLAFTGTLGHCPLYHKLGFTPKSLRRSR